MKLTPTQHFVSHGIKIDVDTRDRLPVAELQRRAVRAGLTLCAVGEWRSPSGRGWHQLVVVGPAPRTAKETVALQLLFGSDPLREAYNLRRARAVDRRQVSTFWRRGRWNVLYGT